MENKASCALQTWLPFVCVSVTVGSILLGAYAFVPQRPWQKRDVTAGVCLIIFSSGLGVVAAVASALPLVCAYAMYEYAMHKFQRSNNVATAV